jgi:endonuclease-3
METNQLADKAQTVYQRLLAFFGMPEWGSPTSPLDELVSTILSQNTNDRNRDLAFHRLKDRFPQWEMVRDAPEGEVVEAIRPAGLANQKGPRIQAVLQQISAECGSLDLDFLRYLPRQQAEVWLRRFKGVGPKTAAIVLLFSLGIPAFPVDTHVYRVTGRLGLRPEGMTVENAHGHLETLFSPDLYAPAHLNLIRLGREVCAARKPNCPACPLADICNYGLESTGGANGIYQ